MKLNKSRQNFVDVFSKTYGPDKTQVSRQELKEFVDNTNLPWPSWLVNNPKFRIDRGVYSMNFQPGTESREELSDMVTENINDGQSLVPSRFKGYVPFGFFNDLKRIIESKVFYTVFISGHSGNGKTIMVEEVCARTKRELVRENITIETDEDDLLGGLRLVDGNTVWQDGPVVTAMRRGAVLLLDEIDLASNKIMALQSILEGKPILIKKTGEVVNPAPGFNVIATANTKGQGSFDGRYIGTNVLNEAFLERFSITVEQDYPNKSTEKKILMESGLEKTDEDFAAALVDWSNQIRKSFDDGVVNDIISTRRLVHIVNAYRIFSDKTKAMELCLNRFDKETKTSFIDLFKKIYVVVEQENKDMKDFTEAEKFPF